METQKFEFENGTGVRVIPVMENETTWFYATDVCKALELVDTRQAVERLDEDERRLMKVPDNGQMRELWLISESGLYALVFTSEKPYAKVFRKWVTSDVLPAIRKAGHFTVQEQKTRQLKMRELSKEIDKIDETIEGLKKEARRMGGIKEEKHKELRAFIRQDDNQMSLDFINTEQVS